MKLKEQKGITLTVLVITIIVMMIIAGATLSMVFDSQGLLKSTEEIKNAGEEFAEHENEKTNEFMDEIDEKIKSSYKDPSGANPPKLKDGMIPVKWDTRNSCWVVTDEKDNEWYSYGDRKWANIMLTDGLRIEGIANAQTAKLQEMKGKKVEQVGSMFVWIPRYAYKIESGYHQNAEDINNEDEDETAGTISIEFLNGTSNIPVINNVKIIEYNEETTKVINELTRRRRKLQKIPKRICSAPSLY